LINRITADRFGNPAQPVQSGFYASGVVNPANRLGGGAMRRKVVTPSEEPAKPAGTKIVEHFRGKFPLSSKACGLL
jgi:hypothetical protein